jgi:hypothetical protein
MHSVSLLVFNYTRSYGRRLFAYLHPFMLRLGRKLSCAEQIKSRSDILWNKAIGTMARLQVIRFSQALRCFRYCSNNPGMFGSFLCLPRTCNVSLERAKHSLELLDLLFTTTFVHGSHTRVCDAHHFNRLMSR